jgi:tetratricopeptide (TPR) repeat protein
MQVAYHARDWPAATALQTALIGWHRNQATAALATPADGLTSIQQVQIHSLAAALNQLGHILWRQDDPGCLAPLQEALMLNQRIGDQTHEANDAGAIGNAYLQVPGLRDLDQAEHWLQHSLDLRGDDRLGRAKALNSLGAVALERFDDASAAGDPEPVLLGHLNAALRMYQRALELTPASDHEGRAVTENQLGTVYQRAGDVPGALTHYQRSIRHEEARGNIYGAGQTRHNIALLLAADNRVSDALHYARAALENYQQAGPGAGADAAHAARLIANLEQYNG